MITYRAPLIVLQQNRVRPSEIFNHVLPVHMFLLSLAFVSQASQMHRFALVLEDFFFSFSSSRLQRLSIDATSFPIYSEWWICFETVNFYNLKAERETTTFLHTNTHRHACHEFIALRRCLKRKYFEQLHSKTRRRRRGSEIFIGGCLNLSSVERGHTEFKSNLCWAVEEEEEWEKIFQRVCVCDKSNDYVTFRY